MEKKTLYNRIVECETALPKCNRCPKKKKNMFLDRCDCGIYYCIKHRHHDCPIKRGNVHLEAVHYKKIDNLLFY